MRLAIALAEVFLVNHVPVPDHHQAAMLAGLLFKLECLIQAGRVHPGHGSDLGGICQRPPAAVLVRWRVIRALGKTESGA